MNQESGREEKSIIPAFCCALGLLLALLAFWVLTNERAVAAKVAVGLAEFPDYLLFQIVCWLRWFFVVSGACLFAAGCLWKPVFGRVLAGDLFEHLGDAKISKILLGVTLHLYVLAEFLAFQKFPLTPDEFAYLFQAKVMASGSLSVPAHPLQKFFTSAFIAHSNGRLFSIMPPGWSIFLVPWVWLGATWIVNPLLSSLSVLLVFWIGKALYGRTTGFVAALLMAVSPFFAYMSGTYFAHPVSSCLVLAVLYGAIRVEQRGGGWFVHAALGLGLAAIPIVHHFDVFLLLPVILLFAARLFRAAGAARGKILLAGCVAAVAIVAFTGWYNASLTGSAIQVPHEVYLDDENFLGEIPQYASMVGISSAAELKARSRRLLDQLFQLNVVMFPLAPLLLFVPALLPGRSRWDLILTAAVLSMFVAYLFYWCRGGFQFGPRYYYPAAGIFYLLVYRGFRALYALAGRGGGPGRIRRLVSLAFVAVVCFQAGLSAGMFRMVRDVVEYARIIQDVGHWFESRGVRESLIFLTPSREDPNTDAVKIYLRVRNQPDFSDTNLTVSDRGEENLELMERYPDRRYFLYEIDIDRLVRGQEMRWKEIRPADYPDPAPARAEE